MNGIRIESSGQVVALLVGLAANPATGDELRLWASQAVDVVQALEDGQRPRVVDPPPGHAWLTGAVGPMSLDGPSSGRLWCPRCTGIGKPPVLAAECLERAHFAAAADSLAVQPAPAQARPE